MRSCGGGERSLPRWRCPVAIFRYDGTAVAEPADAVRPGNCEPEDRQEVGARDHATVAARFAKFNFVVAGRRNFRPLEVHAAGFNPYRASRPAQSSHWK